MKKKGKFFLQNLHCADCIDKIEKKLQSVDGLYQIKISLAASRMTFEYDPNKISLEKIKWIITSLDFKIVEEIKETFSLKNRESLFSIESGTLFIIGLFIHFFIYNPVIFHFYHTIHFSYIFFIGAMIFGGFHAVKRAGKELLNGIFVVDSLMVLGAIGALLIDAFLEAAAVLFLFSIAGILENYSVERSRKSLKELVNLAPKVASVKKDNKFIETPIKDIHIGGIVAVKAGERISVDGIIKNGHSSVNQAPITGESLPVSKNVGDEVYAGTINQNGYLEIEVTKESQDTTLAKIIELVEHAEGKKAPTERFIDKFAKYFTPSVILLAVCITIIPTYVFGQPFGVWFYKSLLLLLISCPCALALSTPISIVSGITSGARNGVLFKGGVYVEKLAKIDTIAFDKTGTLTEGKPIVTDVIPFNNFAKKEVLSIASSLECRSDHPLGKAIIEEAEKEGTYGECTDFTSIPGQGIKGKIGNEEYLVGRTSLFDNKLVKDLLDSFNKLEDEGKTTVLVGKPDQIIGVIGITDKIRDGSRNLIKSLHKKGIKQIVMITGDNKRTAKAVAEKIGIDEYYAELLPEQKVSIIEKIKKKRQGVAMVGDGVNDAPSLATADLGIAMGVVGSDTALEVADIALMNDDISQVSYLLTLGKKTMSVIKQNIAGAIGVKLILAILVFPGLVTLWMAVAIGDMGISLAVIMNALRLSKVKT